MTRYVRMYRYDPVHDPGARLRLEYVPEDGIAQLIDEDVHPEQADNPDARHRSRASKSALTSAEVLWLAQQFVELAVIMARDEATEQKAVDLDGVPQHEPTAPGEIVIDHDSEPTIPGVVRRKDSKDE